MAETKTERIEVRVTPSEKAILQVKAAKQGVTVSDLLIRRTATNK